MTTLDPLFRLLVRALSAQQPPRIHQPIAINELLDSILPYRLVRRELGVDSAEDYETLLLRLCAGEGDFVQTDPATQAVLLAELQKPLADLALLRVYGDTHIVVRTDPLLTALDIRPEERYAPPGAPTAVQAEDEEAEPADEEVTPPVPAGLDEPDVKDEAWVPDPVFEANAGALVAKSSEPPEHSADPESPQESDKATGPVRCPFCGGLLPPRMMINFCPHCGMGQDVGTCRSCGADMDVGWRYCVSCGEDAQGGLS